MWLALSLQLLFLALAFGLRCAVQWSRTGDLGFRAVPRGSFADVAGVLLIVAAAILSVIGSLLAGRLPEAAWLDRTAVAVAGAAIAALGIALVLWAQFEMGASWRIGVDRAEVTELVTSGPFRAVRNPIFSGMLLFWAGLALVAPNIASLLAPFVALAGVEVQVRLVEEPYLLATHGERYQAYAARAGRLVPWLGRLAPSAGAPPRTAGR
jgi:protein-S-isoprenylcysteine O-methyltransferase Ste14